MTTISDLAKWLLERDDIAVIGHVSLDGDALGSGLALVRALRAAGRRAAMVSAEPVPHMYAFLPGTEEIVSPEELSFEPRALLYEDAAALDRAGDKGALGGRGLEAALIDHHATNTRFCPVAVVDGGASATGEMALQLIDEMGVAPDGDMAVCLYAAIASDTGNFSFSNTTPRALNAVAECLKTGVDVADMSFRLFRMRSAGRTRLLGRALDGIEYPEGGQIALMRLTREDFRSCGASDADTEGVVNFGIDTSGVEVAILAVERENAVKFSLRSRSRVDVAQMARELGGGGHSRAAGVTLEGPMDEAVKRVLATASKALRDR